MEILPDDVLGIIYEFVSFPDIKQFYRISKYYYDFYHKYTNNSMNTELNKQKEKYLYIKKYFCNTIINLIGMSYLLSIPILKWSDSFKSSLYSDRICNIKPNDLKHPVMLGIDNNNRAFIVFRYTRIVPNMNTYTELDNLINKIDKMIDDSNDKHNISIMYQKYKSDRNIWSTSFMGSGIDIIQAPGWVINKLRIRDPYLGYNINQLLTKKNMLLFPVYDYMSEYQRVKKIEIKLE